MDVIIITLHNIMTQFDFVHFVVKQYNRTEMYLMLFCVIVFWQNVYIALLWLSYLQNDHLNTNVFEYCIDCLNGFLLDWQEINPISCHSSMQSSAQTRFAWCVARKRPHMTAHMAPQHSPHPQSDTRTHTHTHTHTKTHTKTHTGHCAN